MLGLRTCWSQKATTSMSCCWILSIQVLISYRTYVGSIFSEISEAKLDASSSACWLPLHCQNFSLPNLMRCSSWDRCVLVQEIVTCLFFRKNLMFSHKFWLEEEGLVLAWGYLWKWRVIALASIVIRTVPVVC